MYVCIFVSVCVSVYVCMCMSWEIIIVILFVTCLQPIFSCYMLGINVTPLKV